MVKPQARGKGNPVHTVLFESGDTLVARSATLREWVVSHVCARRLDLALAAGAPPEASAALALRAETLASAREQALLADRIDAVLHQAWQPAPPPGRAVVPVRRDHVLDSAEALRALRDQLRSASQVPVRGIARVVLLLEDGAGPLYRAGSRPLRDAVNQALEACSPAREGN